MDYLEEFKPRFTPKKTARSKSDEERQQEWQNEGHEGIKESFLGDETPQEREDRERLTN